jgi:hypothetical protein
MIGGVWAIGQAVKERGPKGKYNPITWVSENSNLLYLKLSKNCSDKDIKT